MNRKYRQSVEMLFRKGYLRVVIATGTLSLGINMPCATVVFSGDSVFLTALNFRQAAGRAGRRGFDLLGNVVFHGITRERACRLLSSRLPDLSGHFPITTTLVLRLFALLHGSNSAPYAVKAINSLLSQPRLYLGGESFKEQVLHHLRFSIDYLRRQDLLGPSGEPANFTSCVSHLYFTENSSFAFHGKICASSLVGDRWGISSRPAMSAIKHIVADNS
jgi:ATP-dependent RNA helicase DDX60